MIEKNTITIIKISNCSYCGSEYIKKHNRQTYCCEECSYYGSLEKTNNRVRRYRIKKRKNFGYESVKNLGGGHLGPNPKSSFEEEHRVVKNEKRRLRLKI